MTQGGGKEKAPREASVSLHNNGRNTPQRRVSNTTARPEPGRGKQTKPVGELCATTSERRPHQLLLLLKGRPTWRRGAVCTRRGKKKKRQGVLRLHHGKGGDSAQKIPCLNQGVSKRELRGSARLGGVEKEEHGKIKLLHPQQTHHTQTP